MQARPRARSHAWPLLAVAMVGAGVAVWALAPMSSKQHHDDPGPQSAATETREPTPEVDLARLRRAIGVLSQAQADPAGADRRGAMGDLLSVADAPSKLTMLLEATAADPTAPDKDPLWPELVEGLSATFRGDGISSGMDLMFVESRARARDALVSSFAQLALERTDELTAPQRQKLTEYFIDLHNRVPPLQRREVEAAARKIAGNDVADLMQGKGMASDEELEVQRDYKRSLEQKQPVAAQ